MRNYIKHLSACLLLMVSLSISAQELRTSYFMETSNFRHQMNPALLDSPYFSTLFGHFNVGLTGNIGAKNFIYETGATSGYKYTTFMSPTVSASRFLGDLHKRNRSDIYLNWNILSVGFKAFGGVNLLEVNMRSNTHVTLPYELFEFIKTTGAKEHYDLSDIGARSQSYMELALGHARDINSKWRVGGKLKFLVGAAYADFSTENLTADLTQDAWRIRGRAALKASVLNSTLTHGSPSKNAPDGRPRVDELDDISFGLPGFGMAIDLGATYKLLDDLTLSIGLTDLGFIRWKNTKHASSAGDYTFDGFDNIYISGTEEAGKIEDQFEDLGDDLEEMFAVYDDGEKTSSQALAATLNLGAEYTLPVYRKLRFGFLYTSRIHGKYSWHEGMVSVNIRPVKWFEASVNGAATSTGCTAGGALSLKAPHFNFYVAADRFLGKLAKQGVPLNGANGNITFGMTFPL
ncbi:MAG: DUF5723 family protein [Bacteroidales bacterium]|nr:DUF5723 family protein [Bacteroidales bacterium]